LSGSRRGIVADRTAVAALKVRSGLFTPRDTTGSSLAAPWQANRRNPTGKLSEIETLDELKRPWPPLVLRSSLGQSMIRVTVLDEAWDASGGPQAGPGRRHFALRPLRYVLALSLTLGALCAGVFIASSAVAVPPEHDQFTFTFSDVLPAGTVCDFDLSVSIPFSITETVFFDQQGNPVRIVDQVFVVGDTYTNLATGATITAEVSHITQTLYPQTGEFVYRGLNLLVRAPDGRLVTLAGRLTFNTITGVPGRVTPHMGSGLRAICGLLGGNPA
jgi:hypothetical protein